MGIHEAKPAAVKTPALHELQDFIVRSGGRDREEPEHRQHHLAPRQAAARNLAKHKGMDDRQALREDPFEPGVCSVKVVNPH